MGTKRTYEFDIIAKIDAATASVDKLASTTQKQLDSLNFKAGVSAIKDGFDIVAGVAGAVFDKISAFTSKAIDEALEAEKANIALANSLRLTGDYSVAAADHFDKLATSIQRTTLFTDDSVKSSVALAKQYNLTNDEAERTIKVAADLAAVQGTSLEEATRKVSQTFNGFVDKSLAKVIPALKTMKENSLLAGDALALIGNKVKGSAEALADNFTGALFHAKEGLNDIFETFGGFITQNPAIIAGIKEISKGFELFNDDLQKSGPGLKSLVTDGFLLVINTAPKFVAAFERIFNNLAFGKLIIDKIGASLGALAAALLNPFEAGDIFDALGEDLDALDEKFGKTIDSSEAFFGKLASDTQKIVDNVNKAAKAADGAAKKIANVGASTSGFAARKADKFDPEAFKKKVADAAKEPIKYTIDAAVKGQAITTKEGIAIGAGLVGNILKGADGAKKLLAEGLGAAADALLPGIGGAVSEIVGILSQGPEKVKEMVTQFAAAIPDFIVAIVDAVPALIEALIDAVPKLIEALVAKIPELINGIVAQLPELFVKISALMPEIAIALVSGIIQNIPEIISGFAREFLKIPEKFVNAILDLIPGFGGSDGGGVGGFLGNIPVIGGFLDDLIPFADGGRIPDVPQYKNDKGIVKVTAGEQILNPDLSSKLQEYLDGNGGGGKGGPTYVGTLQLQMGLDTFAKISLEADRRGFRVRA